MKDKMINLAVTVGAEAIIVGVYIWAAKKIVKSLDDYSYEEEVCELKEES